MPATTRTTDLGGPLSWVDHGGPDDGQVVVAVHGLGGSHAGWHDLAPLLARRHRVLAVDLAGHGRTPRAGRSASVRANCELLGRFLEQQVDRPAVLLGSSMGAAIALLHAAAAPASVRGLALLSPALPRAATAVPDPVLARHVALCALPLVAERSLARRRSRLGPEAFVQATLELACAHPDRVSAGARACAEEVAREHAADSDADAAYLEAARSVGRLVARARTYRALIATVTAPAVVVQGARDRLVPPSQVQQLRTLQPGWPVHVLDDVGHLPQLEVPERTAGLLLPWLAALPTSASTADHLAGAS